MKCGECLPDQVKLESVITVVFFIVSYLMCCDFFDSEIKCLATSEQTPLAKSLLIENF